MCSRLAILKVWNTSATKSSEQTWRGEQSVPLRASLSLLISQSLVTTPTRAPSLCLSFWEILLEQLGQAPWIWHFQPVTPATVIWLSPVCQWQRSLVSHPSLLRDVVPDPPLLLPWPFPNLLVPLVQQWQGLDLTPGRSALKEITTNKGRMKHYVFNTLEEGERCFYIVLPFSLWTWSVF